MESHAVRWLQGSIWQIQREPQRGTLVWFPQQRKQGSLHALWRYALKWFKRALKKVVCVLQTFGPNLNVIKGVGW